jgi:hypothetical protein
VVVSGLTLARHEGFHDKVSLILQIPAIRRWRSLRFFAAICFALTGLTVPGICVEVEGAAHVAAADHSCCDPAPLEDGAQGMAPEKGEITSLHECAHAPLGRPAAPSVTSENLRIAATPPASVGLRTAADFNAAVFRTDGPFHRAPELLMQLSTTFLRL